MKDNIRWLASILTSVVIVWMISRVEGSFPQFAAAVFNYGILALTIYLLSEIVYSESFRLQERVSSLVRIKK